MLEPLRPLEVFDPDAFEHRRVDVIGCGALGSRVILSLAKLGITNIHAWDFDKVEAHNIANQAFGNHHIGQLKTDAVKELVKRDTGTEITVHNEKVDGKQRLGEFVFVLPDTMGSRDEIWKKGIKFKPYVRVMFEARMGADTGRVYTINPMDPAHIKTYEATLYKDEETEVSACGSSTTVGPTAELLSGLIVWQFIRWFAWSQGGDASVDTELVFSLRPSLILPQKF